jgi:hypothetical protein
VPLGVLGKGEGIKGRQKKIEKTTNVRTYFIWPGFFSACDFVIFLGAFLALSSPCRETPKKRNKKIDKWGKFRRTTPQNIFYHVFLVPLAEKRPKRTKKILKKRRYVRTLFCELAQMYVVFSFYFFCRPL